MTKEALIADIIKKTGLDKKKVEADLREMALGSKQGTFTKSGGLSKFKESVNAYMFIHKK